MKNSPVTLGDLNLYGLSKLLGSKFNAEVSFTGGDLAIYKASFIFKKEILGGRIIQVHIPTKRSAEGLIQAVVTTNETNNLPLTLVQKEGEWSLLY